MARAEKINGQRLTEKKAMGASEEEPSVIGECQKETKLKEG